MATPQTLQVLDRSSGRRLAGEALFGSAFEAILALRILNGGLSLDHFESGADLDALTQAGLPPAVATALERLRTPSGDQWSALLEIALQTGPSYDVASLIASLRRIDAVELKVVMLGSDRSDPVCDRGIDVAVFRAAASGDVAEMEELLVRAEAAGWDAEVRPQLGVPSPDLAALVIGALSALPVSCYLHDPEALGLLERNAIKAQSLLTAPDGAEAAIERVTRGVEYHAEPGISRVVLVPSLVHCPWTLIEAFGDTKIFCYPARSDSELAAPDDVLIGIYRALGDGTRLRLLRRLVAGGATVAELSGELQLAKSTVHEHLLSLRAAGLVRSVVGGYQITPELPDLNWMLKDFLGLEMRRECEGCGAELDLGAVAYICSYECTFCESCAASRNRICPNCGGELVLRPRRSDGRSQRRRSEQSHTRPRIRAEAIPTGRVQP